MGPSAEEEAQFGFNSQSYTPPPPPPQQAQIAPSGAYAGFAAPVSSPQPVQQPAPAVQLQPQNIAPVQMQQPAPAVPGPSLLSRIGNAAIGGASMAIPGLSAVTTYPRVNAVNLGPVTPALESVGNAVGDIGRAAFSSPLGPAIPGAVGPAVGMLQGAGGRQFAGDVGEFLGKSAVPTRLGDIILAAAPAVPEAGRLAGRAAEVASPFARGVAENPTLRRIALEETGSVRVPGGARLIPKGQEAILYHGTPAEGFAIPTQSGGRGGGIAVTPDEGIARGYAGPNGRVIPLKVKPGAKIVDATGTQALQDWHYLSQRDWARVKAIQKRDGFDMLLDNGYGPSGKEAPAWETFLDPGAGGFGGSPRLEQVLRELGYDGIATHEQIHGIGGDVSIRHPGFRDWKPAGDYPTGDVPTTFIYNSDVLVPATDNPASGFLAGGADVPERAGDRVFKPQPYMDENGNIVMPPKPRAPVPAPAVEAPQSPPRVRNQPVPPDFPKVDWMMSGRSRYYTGIAQDLTTGGLSSEAPEDVAAVRNALDALSKTPPSATTVYHGQIRDSQIANFKPGDIVDLPLISTTSNPRLASQYATPERWRLPNGAQGRNEAVIYELQGAPIRTLRANEGITSGRFEVESVSRGRVIPDSEGRAYGPQGPANTPPKQELVVRLRYKEPLPIETAPAPETPPVGAAAPTPEAPAGAAPQSDLERQLQQSLEGKRPAKVAPVTVGQMRAELDAVGRNSGGTPSQVASRYRDMLAREKGGIGTPNENIRNAARDAYSKTLEATGDPAQAYQEARKAARIETQSNERTNSLIQDLQDFVRGEGGGVRLAGPEKAPRTSVPPPDSLSSLGEVPKEGQGVLKKSLNELLGIAGLPQTLLSTGDMSNIYRQGGILGMRHPEAWKAMTEATVKSWGSEEAAAKASAAIHESAWYNFLKNEGLKEYEYGAGVAPGERVPGYTGINESWVGKKLSGQWNVFGKGIPNPVRAAERAYSTGLNVEGFKVAEDYLQGIWDIMHADPKGFNAAEFAKQAKGVIHNVNIARGYGTGRVADVMAGTHAFFSGRNLVSKPQLILAPLTQPGSLLQPSARRMAAENLATFITANLSWMGFMSAAGAAAGGLWSVEMDPRSTDWGKVKFGNTRIDLWNGFGPLVRLIAREATGETKNSKGEIQPTYRPAELLRFFQNKESPAANIIATKLLGQEPAPGSKPAGLNLQTLYNLGVPLLIQDAADALKNSGPVAAGIAGVTSFLGGGAQSYPPPSGERRDTKAQEMGLPDYASASKAQKKQINDELGIQSAPFYTANAKTVEDMDRFLKDAKSAGYGHAVAFNSLFRDVNPMDKKSMSAWNDSKTILDNYYNHLGQYTGKDAVLAGGWKEPQRGDKDHPNETADAYDARYKASFLEAAHKQAQKDNPELDAWLAWWSKGQQKVATEAAKNAYQNLLDKYGQ